ncbi:MAG: hypothetical protein EZS28_039679 [Streblomastix strix]|uniref:Uncharacterized protein n=1 Tax=Streblomastix strix TaxID=222440 RepID=A0A5J4U338_9EUKA|nr:MAG: hypothetical protein EZS28_039679 [Streblomastix strix]
MGKQRAIVLQNEFTRTTVVITKAIIQDSSKTAVCFSSQGKKFATIAADLAKLGQKTAQIDHEYLSQTNLDSLFNGFGLVMIVVLHFVVERMMQGILIVAEITTNDCLGLLFGVNDYYDLTLGGFDFANICYCGFGETAQIKEDYDQCYYEFGEILFTTKDLARLLIQTKIEIIFTDLVKQPNQTAAVTITILTAYWEKFCPKMTAKIVKACCYQYSVGKPAAFTARIVISILLVINSATLFKVEVKTSHLMALQHPDRCVSITQTVITSAIRLKVLIEDQFIQIEASVVDAQLEWIPTAQQLMIILKIAFYSAEYQELFGVRFGVECCEEPLCQQFLSWSWLSGDEIPCNGGDKAVCGQVCFEYDEFGLKWFICPYCSIW